MYCHIILFCMLNSFYSPSDLFERVENTDLSNFKMKNSPQKFSELSSEQKHVILTFDHPLATCSTLVGGKGCQLARLTQMKEQYDFSVPTGEIIVDE